MLFWAGDRTWLRTPTCYHPLPYINPSCDGPHSLQCPLMSLRLLRRVYPTIPLARGLKTSSPPTTLRPHRWMRLGILSGGVLGASLFVGHTIAPLYADDAQAGAKVSSQTSQTPLSTLMRSYVVYTMCSFPTLVDWSPTMLSFFSSVPGLKQVTEGFVRRTFFAQVSVSS